MIRILLERKERETGRESAPEVYLARLVYQAGNGFIFFFFMPGSEPFCVGYSHGDRAHDRRKSEETFNI
jgi:hypothetical protein